MNDKIRGLNLESLLFLDAETVSSNEKLEVGSKEFELWQWHKRDKETDYFLSDKELCDLYERKAALHPLFNKIVCISIGFIKGNTYYYKRILGEEKDIIEEFYTILNKGISIPVSFNGIGFDMPVIRLKAFQNNCKVTLADKFSDSDKKPWNVTDNHIDLMNTSKGTYYYNLSLDGMCYLAGLESPKSDLKGDEVSKEYYENGAEERIGPYCDRDVLALAKLLIKMQGKNPDEVIKNYVDKTGEVAEKQTIALIAHVTNIGSLSDEHIELFRGFVEQELMDKEEVITLVTAALSKTITSGLNKYEPLKKLRKELGLPTVEEIKEKEAKLQLDIYLKKYPLIKDVVEKKTLGKTQANSLIKENLEKSVKIKKEIVKQVEDYLKLLGKFEQQRISKSFQYLVEQFKL